MSRTPIHSDDAPAAIGPYSQAVRAGDLVFISGQIPLDPASMEMVDGGIAAQIRRVLDNLMAVIAASGGGPEHVVRVTVYLTDLGNFGAVNELMAEYFDAPYPARAAVEVSALPRGAEVEMDAILALWVRCAKGRNRWRWCIRRCNSNTTSKRSRWARR
jgi:reactive intermediate/imine deaminase